MKNTLKALKFTCIIFLILISFIACDKDFNTVQSDVLGEENANFNTDKAYIPILAYNRKLESIQINNLSSNLLGVYNDPAYGQTIASMVTQVTPTTFNPNFGENPAIDSVILSIPYYSKTNGVDSEGNTTYSIDSLYGNEKINLTIYQNNYFLSDYKPLLINERQNYYSRGSISTNGSKNMAVTEDVLIDFDAFKGAVIKDTAFVPTPNAVITVTGTGDSKTTNRSVPAFRTKLDSPFWTNTIINKNGQPELSNASNFKNYFRGLYFRAEAINGKGHMILLNMAATTANITIYYSKDSSVAGERIQSTYILGFSGNRLNTFINDYNLPEGDKNLGDETLNLKGMEGSMAVVELFHGMVDCDGDGILDMSAIDCFKETYRKKDANGDFIKVNGNYVLKQLINEAQLIIYEDESSLSSPSEDYHKFDRIYAYDLKNNSSTVDYIIDPTGNTSSAVISKVLSLGLRNTDEDNNVSKYKIRLTEHLNNILIRDSTNTKIGLVLSSNVNITNNSDILNSTDNITSTPSASILMPRGTKLYGTNVSALNENKKMRLELFFTKPKN